MFHSFYTAASGMLMQQRGLAVSANNMANVETPGFKTQKLVSSVFEQNYLMRYENGQKTAIGKGSPARIVESVPTDFDSNMLEPTDYPFDMAINGQGYFNIKGEDTQYLTRNGKFELDTEGFLSLPGVGRVQGENGDIHVGSSNFQVLSNGAVYTDENVNVGTLLITQPPADTQLEVFANGLYIADGVNNQTQIANTTIEQGVIEKSNIDLNREFASVMEMQKAFGANSTALKAIDQINQKTANQIASL